MLKLIEFVFVSLLVSMPVAMFELTSSRCLVHVRTRGVLFIAGTTSGRLMDLPIESFSREVIPKRISDDSEIISM